MPTPIPPPPGSAAPGELYVDLQSRTLWLGVSAAVSADLAVLVSDIVGVGEGDVETLAAANTYTDSQVATRAPMVHSHVAADITNFAPAVEAVIAGSPSAGGFERGMVMMYHGPLTDIGVGPLAGWALCDGNNGTPNLRDRFVLGAGNKLPGVLGGAAPLPITGGPHVHTINNTTLTLDQIPVHNHGGATLAGSAHAHGGGGLVAASAGAHAHTVAAYKATSEQGTISVGDKILKASDPTVLAAQPTSTDGAHTHSLEGVSATESAHTHPIAAAGGGLPHGHTIVGGGGSHDHAVTAAVLREAIPYFALAYIMKL